MADRKVVIPPEEAYQIGKAKGLKELSKFHVSDNFTWGEVFVNETEADFRTATLTIYKNAAKQAGTMEVVRRTFGGKPVIVVSWYRSPEHNKRAKGAKGSYHLLGLATDFRVSGYEGVKGNRKVQDTLNKHPAMSKCGLEFTKGNWTHVDSRGYKERFYA